MGVTSEGGVTEITAPTSEYIEAGGRALLNPNKRVPGRSLCTQIPLQVPSLRCFPYRPIQFWHLKFGKKLKDLSFRAAIS